MSPFVVAGKLERQRLTVSVNGNRVGEWMAMANGTFRMKIPKRYFQGRQVLQLSLRFPDAVSQFALGLNQDRAVLGVQMKSIRLHPLRGVPK